MPLPWTPTTSFESDLAHYEVYWEGWYNWSYLDAPPGGNPTIGVGFNLKNPPSHHTEAATVGIGSNLYDTLYDDAFNNYVTTIDGQGKTHYKLRKARASQTISDDQVASLLNTTMNDAIDTCRSNLGKSVWDGNTISDARRIALIDYQNLISFIKDESLLNRATSW